MTWLVEWGKIIVLHERLALYQICLKYLPNNDVKFSYLTVCRQHEPAAVNLFFSAFTWKSFVPIKWEDTSHLSFNITNMKWSQNNKPTANGSILKCRFRFSRYRSFLNIFRIKISGHNRAKKVVIQKRVNFDIERLKLGLLFTAWLILDALESSVKQ